MELCQRKCKTLNKTKTEFNLPSGFWVFVKPLKSLKTLKPFNKTNQVIAHHKLLILKVWRRDKCRHPWSRKIYAYLWKNINKHCPKVSGKVLIKVFFIFIFKKKLLVKQIIILGTVSLAWGSMWRKFSMFVISFSEN